METIVSSTAPAAAPPVQQGAPPASGSPPADDAIQQQLAELKEQVAEANRTAQYWADRAQKADKPATKTAPAEEPDDTDVLEEITTKGLKGFDDVAKKRGYIKREEVEQIVETRANLATTENDLMGKYPDLRNKNSEFFQATALAYGDLIKDGVPKVKAMSLAASQTELEFLRAGKIKTPQQQSEQTKEEKEAARLRRVAAQGGGQSGRRPAEPDPEDDELDDSQKRIAAAFGITEEAYAARAKKGVAIRQK